MILLELLNIQRRVIAKLEPASRLVCMIRGDSGLSWPVAGPGNGQSLCDAQLV